VVKTRPSSPPSDRLIFSLAGVWFVVLTFVGFSRTFFLRTIPEPLPVHLVVHGIVNSVWVVLFLVQSLLISMRRVRWHMSLGAAATLVLFLIVPVGFHVVLVKTAAGIKSIDEAGFNLTELTLGFAFALTGLAYRRQPFLHKRLMLFATIMLTVAAADRVALVFGLEDMRLFRKALPLTPDIALVIYDALLLRRIPILSISLLALVWLVTWFVVSDLLFLHPAGETIIRAVTRIFVW